MKQALSDAVRTLARPLFTELIALLPKEKTNESLAVLYTLVAQCAARLGDTAESKRLLGEALRVARQIPLEAASPMLWPTVADTYLVLGDTAGCRARFSEGIAQARKKSTASVQFTCLAMLAIYQALDKDPKGARATWALAQKADPKQARSTEGAQLYGGLLCHLADVPGAIKTADQLQSDPINQALLLFQIAKAQYKRGDKAGAKATGARAIAAGKRRKDGSSFLLGILLADLVRIGQVAEAKRLAAGKPDALREVAEALAETGDLAGARALNAPPSPAMVYALCRAKDLANATTFYQKVDEEKAYTMQDEPIRMLAALASAAAQTGDLALAQKHLDTARSQAATPDPVFGDKHALLLASLLESFLLCGRRFAET